MSNGKILSLIIVLMLVSTLAITGCAPKPAPAPAPAPAPVPPPTVTVTVPAPAPAPAPKPQPVVIRLAADHSAAQASAYAENWFAEQVAKRIPGSEVRVYPASSLYKPAEALNMLSMGNLEMYCLQPTKTAGWDPWLNIITQPLCYTTYGAVLNLPNTKVAKMLEDRLEGRGVKVLSWGLHSLMTGIGAKKRLITLDDFKGMKIRVSAPLTQNPLFESFGASPVAMAWGDVPPALATGVLDACATSMGGFKQIKSTHSYFTVIGPGTALTDFYLYSVSKVWWEKLDPVTRDAVKAIFDEFIQRLNEMAFAEDAITLEKYGTKDPTKPEYTFSLRKNKHL